MSRDDWLVLPFEVLRIGVSARQDTPTKPEGASSNQPFRLPSPRPPITHIGLRLPDDAGINVKHHVLDGRPDSINAYSRLTPVTA